MDAGPATRAERNALSNAPAGEETVEARLVALSRASLAGRIKHGVPMAELAEHIATLTAGEEELLNGKS